MNEWDRNNLNYIRSLNERQFDEWAASLDEENMAYAIDLLKKATAEVISKTQDILDEVHDTAVANEYLKKFRL